MDDRGGITCFQVDPSVLPALIDADRPGGLVAKHPLLYNITIRAGGMHGFADTEIVRIIHGIAGT